MPDNLEPEPKDIYLKPLKRTLWGLLLLGFVFLAVYYTNMLWLQKGSFSTASWGAVGDYWGGMLNPLVAAAAILMLGYSIYIQRRELEVAQKTLRETKEELEITNKHYKSMKKSEDVKAYLQYMSGSLSRQLKHQVTNPWGPNQQCSIESILTDIVTGQVQRSVRPMSQMDAKKMLATRAVLEKIQEGMTELGEIYDDVGGSFVLKAYEAREGHYITATSGNVFNELIKPHT